jgi:hypothetical protein
MITILPGMVFPMLLAPTVALARDTRPILLALMAAIRLLTSAPYAFEVWMTFVPA